MSPLDVGRVVHVQSLQRRGLLGVDEKTDEDAGPKMPVQAQRISDRGHE